jgi:hypothetical protein
MERIAGWFGRLSERYSPVDGCPLALLRRAVLFKLMASPANAPRFTGLRPDKAWLPSRIHRQYLPNRRRVELLFPDGTMPAGFGSPPPSCRWLLISAVLPETFADTQGLARAAPVCAMLPHGFLRHINRAALRNLLLLCAHAHRLIVRQDICRLPSHLRSGTCCLRQSQPADGTWDQSCRPIPVDVDSDISSFSVGADYGTRRTSVGVF